MRRALLDWIGTVAELIGFLLAVVAAMIIVLAPCITIGWVAWLIWGGH